MSVTRDDVMRRAAKLLKLAQSDNPGEAAAAAAKAQELIDRYELHAESLEYGDQRPDEPDEEIQTFWGDPLERGQRVNPWKMRLATAICKHNECKAFMGGGSIQIVGRPSNVETVRYLYSWLVREIDRLATRDTRGYGRAYKNNWRLGAVETIRDKLRAQRRETQAAVQAEAARASNKNALVVVNRAITRREERQREVERWASKTLGLRTVRTGFTPYNDNARERGRRAAEAINLGRARGALPG